MQNPELPGLLLNQRALTDSIAALSALPDAHQRQPTIDEERRRLREIEARITELSPAPTPPAYPQPTP